CRSVYQRTMGSVLSPLSAFLLLQGIETVAVRIDRHVENGKRVAEFLRAHPGVEWVNYTGFPDNPYHALAQKYLGGRACSLMTFGIRGGFEAGTKFYDALRLIRRLVNIGDAKSLACHPASTTHRQMTPEEQHNAGVTPEMIRLSTPVRLRVFAIPEVPRGARGRSYVAEHAEDLGALRRPHLDGLIVTGLEPRAPKLVDEPYWQALADLIDWARARTTSAVWSC